MEALSSLALTTHDKAQIYKFALELQLNNEQKLSTCAEMRGVKCFLHHGGPHETNLGLCAQIDSSGFKIYPGFLGFDAFFKHKIRNSLMMHHINVWIPVYIHPIHWKRMTRPPYLYTAFVHLAMVLEKPLMQDSFDMFKTYVHLMDSFVTESNEFTSSDVCIFLHIYRTLLNFTVEGDCCNQCFKYVRKFVVDFMDDVHRMHLSHVGMVAIFSSMCGMHWCDCAIDIVTEMLVRNVGVYVGYEIELDIPSHMMPDEYIDATFENTKRCRHLCARWKCLFDLTSKYLTRHRFYSKTQDAQSKYLDDTLCEPEEEIELFRKDMASFDDNVNNFETFFFYMDAKCPDDLYNYLTENVMIYYKRNKPKR